MGIDKKILSYLSVYGKENKYKLARALKIDVFEVTKALNALEEEGRIKMRGGRAIFVRGEEVRKKEKEKEKKLETKKEEQAEEVTEKGEEIEEQPEETETTEKTQAEEELEEEQPAETSTEEEKVSEIAEEGIEKERIEGTVKFFNPNKGFGFITGDDGKEYYVHESALKEGVTIEANNRVSFKVVQGDKGPKAEEVGWISQA